MVQIKKLLYVALLTFTLQQICIANPYFTAKKALNFALKLYQKIDQVQKFIDGKTDDPEKKNEIFQQEIFKQLTELSYDINDMKKKILDKLSNNIRDKLTVKTDKLFEELNHVQDSYNTFLDILANPNKYPSALVNNFANMSTSYSLVELRTTINDAHKDLVDNKTKKESIISIINRDATAGDTICVRGQSSQQFMHMLYTLVGLADTKALLMRLYAYDVLEKSSKENYAYVRNKEVRDYYMRLNNSFSVVKDAMSNSSREIWRCDPNQHAKDVTFTKLQDVFQGFFMYEADAARNYHIVNLYKHKCVDYTDERLRCRSNSCFAQSAERRCTGHIRDCQHIANIMQVCHSPPGSDRRYDWMKTEDKLYGRDSACNRIQNLKTMWPYFFVSYCFCTCESEKRDADRYFSLQNVTSDVMENKVITGVKLERLNNVFYIKIQQGKLSANGSITGERTWKAIDEIPHEKIMEMSTYHHKALSYPYENDERRYFYDEWTDFHKNRLVYAVTNDQNTVYLDDLNARPNEVLTGLRFQQIDKNLRMEVQATEINYKTGQLYLESSRWIAQHNQTHNRLEVKFVEPDDPIGSEKSDQYSSNNQYVRFSMTDLKRDLRQSTIPFLDVQEVITFPTMPVSGAGLFHKGSRHSGGFLALKLMHFDDTLHFTEETMDFDEF